MSTSHHHVALKRHLLFLLLGQLHHQLFINVLCSVWCPSARLYVGTNLLPAMASPVALSSWVTWHTFALSTYNLSCLSIWNHCNCEIQLHHVHARPQRAACRHRGPPTQVNSAGCTQSHRSIKILALAAGAGETGFFFSSPLILHHEIYSITEALDGSPLRFEVRCLHYSFSRGPSPWRVFYTCWAHPTYRVYPLSLLLTH